MWAGSMCYSEAMRDVLGLKLPEFGPYQAWEDAGTHGGFRVLHPEFCIVSDFPEIIRIDTENRPHCETGPSHRWRDGWSLYHWHGVSIPGEWVENPASLDARTALTWKNVEQRRAAIALVGWDRIISEMGGRVIEADPDPEIGSVIELTLPDLGPRRFLRMQCATGRWFAEGIDPKMPTPAGYSLPHCAQAHRVRLHPAEWRKPTTTA